MKAFRVVLLAALCAVTIGICVAVVRQHSENVAKATLDQVTAASITAGASQTTSARTPTVAFIGDSYSVGSGSSDPEMRWTTLVSHNRAWREVNLAQGATGYKVGKDGCPLDACPNYPGVIPAAVAAKPDLVVVAGGRNDATVAPADEAAAVAAFYAALSAALPDAQIIVVSPIWDSRAAPAALGQIAKDVQTGAASVHASYLDIGQPLAGHPEFVTSDEVHPNDKGHAAIAAAFLASFNAAKAAGVVS